MANVLNMEVYGVPILTYGLVGVTTAVLAYATAISGVGEKVAETVSQGSMNPFSSPMPMPTPPEPVSEPTPTEEPVTTQEEGAVGGKKSRKTPRHKRLKKKGGKKNKSQKNKK